MRVLITGASGFVGSWLTRTCLEAGDEVYGVSRGGEVVDGATGLVADLTDAPAVAALVGEVNPDVVYHLAALSHVGQSWEDPQLTLTANVGGTAALLEAVRHRAPGARLLYASSCEVYGTVRELPVREDAPFAPVNPYAVSKAAGDMLAKVYADAHGLDVIITRPFNHVGPGQRDIFIVSSLARQAAQARVDGASQLRIVTGNPHTRRDYTDVRDVCSAYRQLVDSDAGAGVYNVCSGVSHSAAELVALVTELIAPITVEHTVDPARVRAHEVMDHRGSAERLHAATGWTPQIPLIQTVADTIAFWERELMTLSTTD